MSNQIEPQLIALRVFARQVGVSRVTLWRWRNSGWLTGVVNIAGTPYITSEGIAEFKRRAVAGEFARECNLRKDK